MDVRRLFIAARERWWVVILIMACGTLAAVGITSRQEQQYESSVTFYLSTPAQPADAYQASLYGQQLVNTYVKLLGTDELARRVVAKGRLHQTVQAVTGKISGSAELNTVLLTAHAIDSTPAGARRITVAIAAVFGPMVSSLTNVPAAGKPSVVLVVVSGPTTATKVAPTRKLNYALGAILGLVLGLAFVAVRELMDKTIRADNQLAAANIRPIGSIGRMPKAASGPLLVGELAGSIAEEMRKLRTSLQHLPDRHPIQVIAVVSPRAADGKSTVAANLALAFAEADLRTLLIDANLRKPDLAHMLGLDGTVGLANVLQGEVRASAALQTWGANGLCVLPGGSVPEHPAELLASRQMAALIVNLRGQFDIVVIDTPALGPTTDASVTSLLSDGALVVVRNGRTTNEELQSALQALRSVDARLLGAVRNIVALGSYGDQARRGLTSYHRKHSAAQLPGSSDTNSYDSGHTTDGRRPAANGERPTPRPAPPRQSSARYTEPPESDEPKN